VYLLQILSQLCGVCDGNCSEWMKVHVSRVVQAGAEMRICINVVCPIVAHSSGSRLKRKKKQM